MKNLLHNSNTVTEVCWKIREMYKKTDI